VALYLQGIAPVGEEARRGGGMEHPPPLSPAYQPDTLFPWEVEKPPPPGRSAASSRPLQGAGSKWRLARWPCPGEQELW
jgi:hypothetical protein